MTEPALAPPRRRWILRLGLALVATVIAAKACDLVIGWIDPFGISHFTNNEIFKPHLRQMPDAPTGWEELVPDGDIDAGVHYRINRLGFRGREFGAKKPADTYRIVVLGDSVAFGWGVPLEETMTSLIERELNARGGKKVEVLNLAVQGYESIQQYTVFQKKALALEPDLVLFFFNRNDVAIDTDELRRIGELATARGRGVNLLRVLLEDGVARRVMSATLPNLRHLLMFELIFRMSPQDEHELIEQYDNMKDGTRLSLDLYARAARAAEARGVKLALFDLYGVPAIAKGCAERNVPYASIAWDRPSLDHDLRNSASDPHPNARGHAMYAENALRALDALKLLPEGLRK